MVNISAGPHCLLCAAILPRLIQVESVHDVGCPWHYFIVCLSCGSHQSVSKLLGFWGGCSDGCEAFKFKEKKGEMKN